MKVDLKKCKSYTIIFMTKELEAGQIKPTVTIFKSYEEAVMLEIKKSFANRNADFHLL